ncbi:MAG: hypothetical protein DRN17_00015 [Thermoplasmata archaeon]|nr:MAG: hypothetical protein DRN17_00015 [Thermoplasmata archaeon]
MVWSGGKLFLNIYIDIVEFCLVWIFFSAFIFAFFNDYIFAIDINSVGEAKYELIFFIIFMPLMTWRFIKRLKAE